MFDPLFKRSGLSIDRLRSFLRVAEAGAIARAAPRNPVQQSQLSRQIGELEEFFGQALVARKGRGLALTPAGARLAITVRELLQGLTDVAATADQRPLAASLGAGDSLLHGWIIPRGLPALLEASGVASTLTLTLVSLHGGEAAARLLDARLDLAMMRASEVPGVLRTRPLGTLDYALFVPRRLLGRVPRTAVLDVLARVPLAVQYGDPEIVAALAPLLAEAGVAQPALHCETFPQAQRAVATKRFASLLPTLARIDLPEPEFAQLPLPPAFTRKVVLAWHPRLERQRPEIHAVLPALAHALHLPAR